MARQRRGVVDNEEKKALEPDEMAKETVIRNTMPAVQCHFENRDTSISVDGKYPGIDTNILEDVQE